jgi:raffinose/stachyose/melibiose transport system permease protein
MHTEIGGIRTKIFNWVKFVILFLLFVVYMFPFLLILLNSFKTKISILKSPVTLADSGSFTVNNFSKAFEKMNFMSAFTNSTFITVISVTIIILISSMTAYLFVRVKSKANSIIFATMVASMIIPFQAIMIPLIHIYGEKMNLLNMRGTLIFMHVGFSLSMAVFIYHGFIKSNIPLSLEEAALLDGCTRTQTFFKIVFPLLKPTTATIIVLDVLAIWNDYLLPSLILGKKELYTLPLSTYSFYGTYSADYGTIMAGLVLTTLPVIILYFILQKHIISGVVSGAVKA